ncbi:regulation of nuclear pre-mRNA domain-containing protein 1A-like [Impatiens glandulifera]|uniref:regulation of nuclear pre-mRNA domain-containing protein 1A-like n=1 Tax=Impatiens glandulifera TaxID=253017 RepID=UPI001FB11AA4|nr:regulation of nuclear pre-mRNA domain-containing protein 1A-like [Impatiens glandulifera]
MGSSFDLQIFEDRLTKLNHSQQSIETLSHWCIFHMSKAKQVIETWDKKFHSSRREQRLPFLYLANDILQNSRRKGLEFASEFRKVLPGALRDVMKNGDESGRNAVLRLIGIWEERKVFVSKGQSLKEELLGRQPDNSNRNLISSSFKLKPTTRNGLEKIVSGYEAVYRGPIDEDGLLRKCSKAISCMEKVNKKIRVETDSEKLNGSSIDKEFEVHHAVLRDCIEQLTEVESSRADLMSSLREALQEQELKIEQVRRQIKVARSLSEQTDVMKHNIINAQTAMPPPPPSSPPPVQPSPPPSPPPPPPMHSYPVPHLMQTAAPVNFSYFYGQVQPSSLQPPNYPISHGAHQVANAAAVSSYSDSTTVTPPPNVVYQGPQVGFYGLPANGTRNF